MKTEKLNEALLQTEIGKTYWNEQGIYQEEYNKLYEQLVPSSGSAKTLNGELIRAISRLSYDYFNNGNCNACVQEWHSEEVECPCCGGYGYIDGDENEECEECGGSGVIYEDVEDDPFVDEYYGKFLCLIRECVSVEDVDIDEVVDGVENVILSANSIKYFTPEVDQKYSRMFDVVIYYVLNNDDKALPDWYVIG